MNFLHDLLQAFHQVRNERKALRNAEHARAIADEYGSLCDSLQSQRLRAEIDELRTGKVMPIQRRAALRGVK